MIGPVRQIQLGNGASADLYLLRFDKNGRLQSPKTAELAVKAARAATDVYLFSHGWNNVYADALAAYVRFAEGFIEQRRKLDLPVPGQYRPVLIGVIWPSTWFVPKRDRGPVIAGGGEDDAERERDERMLAEITSQMSSEAAAEFIELIDGADSLGRHDAERVAELMRAAIWSEPDDDGASAPPDNAAVLSAWSAISNPDEPFVEEEEDVKTVDRPTDEPTSAASAESETPKTAGGTRFSPRDALRLGSVWTMKARAGKVGVIGVRPLLEEILARGSDARVHLVGHSFGARVLLSAVASARLDRKVRSMLLLQPAVNRWCFAEKVIGTEIPGGYRVVLQRVEQPVLATRSKHDYPLHQFFHLAVRGGSLGEIDIAAVGDTDRYGALGGYRPQQEADFPHGDLLDPGKAYNLTGTTTVISLDGSRQVNGKPAIGGHGDINNPFTWWALHALAAPPKAP
ncbi:hypothetical protein [Agromyces sp. NPDC058126]|uniref:hypothetical protein n=1 Tax=Agromyces sp. NPDC058126 TaxID=3346350 RepID=UPI0036DC58F3